MNENYRPKAYIDKCTHFASLDFYIDERAFVPNKETELLLEQVSRAWAGNQAKNGLIIDVGTGCGILAIALALRFPGCDFIGTDISNDALEVAKINAAAHQVNNVEWLLMDLVSGLTAEPALIVCNLPWGTDEYMLKSNTAEAFTFMPEIAIYPVNGPLGVYQALCQQVIEKGWRTTIYAEVGRMPRKLIGTLMPANYHWDYLDLSPDYAIMIVNFDPVTR